MSLTEKEFMGQIKLLAQYTNWIVYHTFDSRRSDKGFPDLVLLRPPELIVAELKTDRGKVTREQAVWIDSFSACGIESYVWRPAQFGQVLARLRRRRLPSSPQVFPLCRMGFHQRCSSPVQCGCECHAAERTRQ